MNASAISNQDFLLQRYVDNLISQLNNVTEFTPEQQAVLRAQMTVTYGHFLNEINRLKSNN